MANASMWFRKLWRTAFIGGLLCVTYFAGWFSAVRDSSPSERDSVDDYGVSPFYPNGPLFVLVLSSLPRSGSTLMAESLSALRDSVLFFEPLWLQEKTPCIHDKDCVADYLLRAFTCTYDEYFEEWLRNKNLFFGFYHPDAHKCIYGPKKSRRGCVSGVDVRGLCRRAPLRFMKVIRSKLEYLEKYISDSSVNLKVIYLTRDPRGSLNSIRRFKSWNKDPYQRCRSLEDDLLAYDTFSEMFPSKVLHVKYEDFCLDPEAKMSQIMTFLLGTPDIPQELRNYLEEHMSTRHESKSMSTYKESKKEFEAWRQTIPEELLAAVENEPACSNAIKKMGHNLFESLDIARNLSVPLFAT